MPNVLNKKWRRLHLEKLSLLLAVLLLVWAFRQVSLQQVFVVLARFHWSGILILIFVNVTIELLMGSRWWVLIQAIGYKVKYLPIAAYRVASFAVSYFTPGPQFGGEPLQVYLLKKKYDMSVSAATASVTLDKLFELFFNFSFLTFGMSFIVFGKYSSENFLGMKALFFVVLISTVPIAALVLLWSGRKPFSFIVRVAESIARIFNIQPGVVNKFKNMIAAVEDQAIQMFHRNSSGLIYALFFSFILLAGGLLEFWLLFYFLGLSLSPIQLVILMTAARLAFLMPLPAGLGTLEASQIISLKIMGLDPTVGFTACIVIRIRDLFFGTIGLILAGLALRNTKSTVLTQ